MPTVAGRLRHLPHICAHACTVDGGPSHTLAGVRTLVREGVEMVEVDVRRAGDGVLVAHHDDRLPDGRLVREQTSAEIASSYPQASRPATVAELVAALGRATRLQMDLKEEGIEEQALGLALAALPPDEIVVTTLSALQVERVKALRPDVRVGLSLNRSPVSAVCGLHRARRSGADLLAVHQVYLRTWLPALARLPLFAWTVDDDARLEQVLRDRRVACVITNRPLRAHELLP